ncbi:uncharacterized protein G2W53_006302 [Senna tora]|uniref:Uncharacterized protein n=1 Tax=Senna tora TaxID=362788 RepID=A0A834X4X3_9FABA|nr:uncharacterized protein G2W53_006302 [Senna tora]
MAGSHCTVFSLPLPSSKPTNRRTYPVLVVSSIPTPNSSKVRHRRKNHLRPKILKTLTTSRPSISPLIPPESPLSPPQQTPEGNDLCVEAPADGAHSESIAADAGEGGDLEELQVSETTGASGEYNGIAGKLTAGSILKYGAFLVGAFVLQTILSVYILLDDDSKQKAGDLDLNGKEKRSVLFGGSGKSMGATNASGVVYLENQLEMEKKIEEIKLMAREARRTEEVKKEEENGDPESDDDSAVSDHRLGIEKEIGDRLLKLQDKMNSDKDKSAFLQVINNLGKSVKPSGGVAKDNNNVNKGNGTLKFRKKLKYRSPLTKPTKTPKGFPGIRDYKASDAKSRNSASKGTGTAEENGSTASGDINILYEEQVDQRDMETQESDSRLSLEDEGKLVDEEAKTLQNSGMNLEAVMDRPNVETGSGIESNERSNGGSPESSFERSSVEVSQSRKSSELRTRNSQGIVEENQDTSPILEKDDVLSINGNPKHGITDNVSAVKKDKQANTEMDMWWLNLRYVLVILMRRGSKEEEGPRGLYSLKITSQEQDQSVYAYTVAFEDHADAKNFCFLLESFFEDLGDFSADAVPMSIQELHEAVKSHGKKVVVVKKRQLQLYAGQPLSDVETILCSLVQQHQNVVPADSR